MGALWDHPNIVTVFASAFTSDERPCIVMKLFHEGSYSQVLRRSGPVVLDELLLLSVKVAGALATGAQRGGDPRRCEAPEPSSSRSLVSQPWATSAYRPSSGAKTITPPADSRFTMPPRGNRGHSGPAADQYSLAATIYTLALGKRPFELAGSPTGTRTHGCCSGSWKIPTPRLPRPVSDCVLGRSVRAMQRDPAQRYPDLAAFGAALADIERQLGLRQTGIPLEPSPRDAEQVAPETGESQRSQPRPESLPDPVNPVRPNLDARPGTKARRLPRSGHSVTERPSVLRRRRKPPNSLAPANRTATADGTHESEPDDAANPSRASAATDESTTAGEPGGKAEGPGQAGPNRARRVPPTDRAGAPTPQKTAVGSRTVEARVCRGCGLSQPPSASVCGGCGVALGKARVQ